MKRIPVGILGATGAVGQRFVQLLENHSYFEITDLCASERSAGKSYKDVVLWRLPTKLPANAANLEVKTCEANTGAKVVFSGLDSTVAGEIEENFARAGYAVISNSKNHRMDSDVPLLIGEVNPDQIKLIEFQKKRFGGDGFIVTNPNCTTVGLAMVLKPLDEAFGVERVVMTSMQALSGAGYPGVSALDAVDNVVPYIEDEEEKVEVEPLKLLGKVYGNEVKFASFKIDAHCNRVSVRDGHTETLSIGFKKRVTTTQVTRVLKNFRGLPQKLGLPSAPKEPIVVVEEANRPQPVLDRDINGGMSIIVGRIRESNVLDINLVLLVHNTIRGAAGAAILNAELLKARGII
ncbi:MAG: aspartate-semialdehyde dehydrogenase [Candidatus Curtissbacteria bacterium]|nr:aspartate-semialdehyde dehydrogenase [Candidatus Curtissbacteria bacterium]